MNLRWNALRRHSRIISWSHAYKVIKCRYNSFYRDITPIEAFYRRSAGAAPAPFGTLGSTNFSSGGNYRKPFNRTAPTRWTDVAVVGSRWMKAAQKSSSCILCPAVDVYPLVMMTLQTTISVIMRLSTIKLINKSTNNCHLKWWDYL